MRLLSLDFDPIFREDSTRSSFASDLSVFDYDVVIWDPARSLDNYGWFDRYRGLPSLNETQSVRLRADISRRNKEFRDFILSGRTLVVVSRPAVECYFDTGERSFSGTGRNRVTTTHVSKLTLQSVIPYPELKFETARGDRIELKGDGPIQKLLRKYKSHLSYHAVLGNPKGAVIANVAGTARALATIETVKSGGSLIIIPPVDLADHSVKNDGQDYENDDDDYEPGEQYLDSAVEFEEDLILAIQSLSGSKEIARPAWATRFATAHQQELRTNISKQQQAVEEARAMLAEAQQASDEADGRDQLFVGSGRALELEVRNVLEALGGEVAEPEPGRDDWRVTFPEGKAVVEVKGVSKSAAEKHAAQLEKWVASSYEETGELHKGLLIVNTWRETPLDERTEQDFPDQMINYSTSRQHALLTGLQLFVIRQQVEAGEVTAETWRKTLLETVGRFEGCDDWQQHLMETQPAENEQTD